MLAQSSSWNLRMASTTTVGFCAVAALSKYTSGWPCTFCFRTGKSSRIFSTSKPAATALLSVLMEFLVQQPLQRLFDGGRLDAVEDVLRERMRKERPCFVLADAARLQVEHALGIELSDGRAVRAAHVIGVNLELR